MSESHVIVPFEGVDDVRFGMTPDEVAAVAGPAEETRHDEILALTTERRGASEFEFDGDTGALSAVYVFKPGRGKDIREQLGGAPYAPALYDGIEVLSTDGFEALCERERLREGIGNIGVLFPDIGILIAGFRKRVPEGRYVIAFPHDQLERYAENWLNV